MNSDDFHGRIKFSRRYSTRSGHVTLIQKSRVRRKTISRYCSQYEGIWWSRNTFHDTFYFLMKETEVADDPLFLPSIGAGRPRDQDTATALAQAVARERKLVADCRLLICFP